MFASPTDVLFKVNGFPVYVYGFVMALACFVGVCVSYFVYKKYNPDKTYDKIIDMSVPVLIIGILGARLYYCMLNPVYYFNNPLEIINIRQGGLSIHGALFFGMFSLIFYANKYKLGCFKILDSFACGVSLAQSIGRWGNFFNSEAFGTPTNLPWKLYIPALKRPEIYANYEFFHPTFLYESLCDLIIFFILLFIVKNYYNKYEGFTFFFYLFLYSIVRFFIEALRVDSALNLGTVPVARVVSIVMFVIALVGIFYVTNKSVFIQNK